VQYEYMQSDVTAIQLGFPILHTRREEVNVYNQSALPARVAAAAAADTRPVRRFTPVTTVASSVAAAAGSLSPLDWARTTWWDALVDLEEDRRWERAGARWNAAVGAAAAAAAREEAMAGC